MNNLYQIRTNTPAAEWDAFVMAHPRGHFLQLSNWGKQKAAYGWTYERVCLYEGEKLVAGAQLLFHPLPMKFGTMAYLPYGGYVSEESQWPALLDAINQVAKNKKAAFFKWEAGFFFEEDPEKWGFIESIHHVQPPRTVMLDIRGTDEDIQERMNQGTRRNLRKAYKNDIRYYHAATEDVDKFTEMMNTTGERNEFGVHVPEYYKLMYDLFVPDNHSTLILAEHEGTTLAGNMVMSVGKTAIYLEGASSNEKRNLMAAYGVQWEGIQWAKKRGCIWYDMWGIPDEDEATLEAQFEERSDGLWGVYRFKRGWGGQIMRSAGAWDFVYNPLIYAAYKTVLNLRG